MKILDHLKYIYRHNYYDESIKIINSLILYKKHIKKIELSKNEKKLDRFTFPECLKVFKKYKHLSNMDLLNQIMDILLKEYSYQLLINNRKNNNRYHDKKELYFINRKSFTKYLLSLDKKFKTDKGFPLLLAKPLTFEKFGNYYSVLDDGFYKYLIDEQILIDLCKSNVLYGIKIDSSYIKFNLCPDFKKDLINYNKSLIKNNLHKMYTS